MAFVGVGQGEEGASRSTPPWEVQFLMGMIQQAGWGGATVTGSHTGTWAHHPRFLIFFANLDL